NRGDLPATEEQLQSASIKAEIKEREILVTLPVDVLLLAALENQIREDNVRDVQARIIIEGANAPTTAEADEYLNEQGVVVIPDILANAGGVIVSYFEWLQGRETQFYTEKEVYRLLIEKMQETMD